MRKLAEQLAWQDPRWGYRPDRGEMAALGHRIGEGMIHRVLSAAGLEPAPRRVSPMWRQFLAARASGVLACDFLHVDTVLLQRVHVVIKAPVRSPRANSFAERFAGTLRRECLDHLLVLGEQHLRKVLVEYSRHYSGHRPDQALRQRSPLREPGQAIDMTPRSSAAELSAALSANTGEQRSEHKAAAQRW